MDKPKRKYSVTEKALAANRRNLELARAVDPHIRFRSTPKRLQASRANLTRALAALRAASLTPDGFPQKAEVRSQKLEAGKEKAEIGNRKLKNGNWKVGDRQSTISNRQSSIVNRQFPDSPAYGTHYTRGLHAVSLRRSARLAGEPNGAFDAHVQLFVEALAPRTARERRLARGIAQIVWRRLRVFSGQARWERASLLYRLREAARGPGSGIEPDESLTVPRLAAGLAFEIERIFSTDLDLGDRAEQLNARLERLSRLWVVGRRGDPRLFELAAPARVTDGALLERSPEAMGNPFMPTGELAAHLRNRIPHELAPFSPDRWGHGRRRGSAHLSFWDHPEAPFIPPGMMLAYLQEGAGKDDARPSGEPPIEPPEALEELWECAWERISQYGHTTASVMVYGYTLPEATLKHLPANGKPGAESQPSTRNDGQASSGNPKAALPTPCSQVIWPRLQLYADVSQGEAGEVQRLLSAQIGGRMRGELKARLGHIPGGVKLQPGQDGGTAAFLMELILLFNRSNNAAFGQRAALPPVNAALHQFLVSRFGASKYFDMLNPVYAEAAAKAWAESRRRVLTDRLAKYENGKLQGRRGGGTAAERVAQAEGHLRDLDEMYNLDCFVPDPELDELLDEPEDPVYAALRHLRPDAEWMSRYRAAASCGMLPLPGWKFESSARCRARVGLDTKRLKVKG